MTERVEDELREMLQGMARAVTNVGDPLTGVESGVRRVVARRRLAVRAGAPLVVVAIVIGASILPDGATHRTIGGTASTSTTPVVTTGVRSASIAPAVDQDPPAQLFRSYLEHDPTARMAPALATGYGGRAYCALRVLDHSKHLADLAVFCQEYYLQDGALSKGSASLVPVRVAFSGVGADARVTDMALPRSGHGLLAELKVLFTPLAASRWQQFSGGLLTAAGLDQSAAQLKARATADVRSGRLHAGINDPVNDHSG